MGITINSVIATPIILAHTLCEQRRPRAVRTSEQSSQSPRWWSRNNMEHNILSIFRTAKNWSQHAAWDPLQILTGLARPRAYPHALGLLSTFYKISRIIILVQSSEYMWLLDLFLISGCSYQIATSTEQLESSPETWASYPCRNEMQEFESPLARGSSPTHFIPMCSSYHVMITEYTSMSITGYTVRAWGDEMVLKVRVYYYV